MLHLVYISSAPFVNTAHYLRDFRVRTFSPKRSRFFPNHFISHIAHVLMLGKVVFQTFSWLCCVFTMCDVFLRNFFQCQRMLQTMFLNRFQPHFWKCFQAASKLLFVWPLKDSICKSLGVVWRMRKHYGFGTLYCHGVLVKTIATDRCAYHFNTRPAIPQVFLTFSASLGQYTWRHCQKLMELYSSLSYNRISLCIVWPEIMHWLFYSDANFMLMPFCSKVCIG